MVFEACSAFTRVTACRLAKSPCATLYIGGSGGFVASTAAPIATGWSDPVPGRVFLSRCGPAPFHGAPNLTQAQVTQVTSTTVSVDAGTTPSGGGIEVRTHDHGWGPSNDRNLLGRFSGHVFSLPRLGRTQNYFLRLYDTSSPPRYSRYAAALHVDYPL